MSIRLVRSSDLSAVAEYAYASVADAEGSVIFTAGACPLDADGVVVAPRDYVVQARA